jgi:hypothetical protein
MFIRDRISFLENETALYLLIPSCNQMRNILLEILCVFASLRREAKARFARQSVAGVPPVKGTVEVGCEYSYPKAAASPLGREIKLLLKKRLSIRGE